MQSKLSLVYIAFQAIDHQCRVDSYNALRLTEMLAAHSYKSKAKEDLISLLTKNGSIDPATYIDLLKRLESEIG